jgi:hypothetical protein
MQQLGLGHIDFGIGASHGMCMLQFNLLILSAAAGSHCNVRVAGQSHACAGPILVAWVRSAGRRV